MVKLIAFHLPQYHVIPENNKWWGNDHTEWSFTKTAKPMFKGHYQPRTPLGQEFYNMCDPNVQTKQAKLAKDNGIYGFCYYHYWFAGRLLLERPLEIMLKNPSVDIPFCFCWATESWMKMNEILIEQTFGDKSIWKNHFDYLLSFFKDSRYIKIDNKPVFVIYRTNNFALFDDMFIFFNELCIEHGFSGIHIIEEVNSYQKEPVLGVTKDYLEFEPMYTLNHDLPIIYKFRNLIKRSARNLLYRLSGSNAYDCRLPKFLLHTETYDFIWNRILSRESRTNSDRNRYLGGFVDWDNTARKKGEAVIIKGASPEKFKRYLSQQISRANKLGSEFIFINAWNEWSEGAYLEPDERFDFAYLKAIRETIK